MQVMAIRSTPPVSPASLLLASGPLVVSTSVVINGPAADILAVDGNAASVVFQINFAPTVTISGLTIRNGQGSFGGGIETGAGGTLTVTDSTLSGNTAAFGGGIFNSGTMTIVNSTVSGNTAGEGAGIYGDGGSTVDNHQQHVQWQHSYTDRRCLFKSRDTANR